MTRSNDVEMMAKAWSTWQRLPLTEPDGRLSRRVQPTSSWTTPSELSLNKGRIYYKRGSPNRHEIRGPADALDNLVSLSPTASDNTVAKFARRWGIVALCAEHGLPLAHARSFGLEPNEEVCSLLGGRSAYVPVDWYREFAQRCRSVLNIASRLHRGVPGDPEDWTAINIVVAHATAVTIDPDNHRLIPYSTAARVDDERESLACILDDWLELTGVRIRFEWDAASPTFGMKPGGLAGAVVMSLVFSVARSGGLAVCASCGRPFTPKRRPAEGRRSYCSDPACKKASVRDAQRDVRARRQRAS